MDLLFDHSTWFGEILISLQLNNPARATSRDPSHSAASIDQRFRPILYKPVSPVTPAGDLCTEIRSRRRPQARPNTRQAWYPQKPIESLRTCSTLASRAAPMM